MASAAREGVALTKPVGMEAFPLLGEIASLGVWSVPVCSRCPVKTPHDDELHDAGEKANKRD